MFEVYMLQPVTAACELFVNRRNVIGSRIEVLMQAPTKLWRRLTNSSHAAVTGCSI